jgi:CRISPR-associated protein Cas5t
MMEALHLYVSVPVASFRVAQAREYWETYPCPPPSTIYGMLLSLVGEPDRLAHQGSEIAIALVSDPHRSVVLRTLWRVRDTKIGPGLGRNRRPDFQELLCDLRLSIWVRQGAEERATPPLAARLDAAIKRPAAVCRFGGLSLGESTHLVDDLRLWRKEDPKTGRLLLRDDEGDLSLPIWPDHVGSQGTQWGQFKLEKAFIDPQPREKAWSAICPPGISS